MNRFWTVFEKTWRWIFAVLAIAAWLTRHGGDALHERLGYGALTVVLLRLAQRDAGSKRVGAVMLMRLGHGAFTAFLLPTMLIATIFVGLSGWLLTTNRFWTARWIAEVHWFSAGMLLILLTARGIVRLVRRKQSIP